MKLISAFMLLKLVTWSIFLLLKSQASEVYITTPEIFSSLGLSDSLGTKENPYTSVQQVLYGLSEGEAHFVYVSPHDHSLDCLSCLDCVNSCEIMRGGRLSLG